MNVSLLTKRVDFGIRRLSFPPNYLPKVLLYFPADLSLSIANTTVNNSYLLFGTMNVSDNKVVGCTAVWNYTNFSVVTNFANKIYSNGACDVYLSG